MAKVGIMSMQRIANYGSFLQAYALKHMIENMGHEVQFVDYQVEAPIISEAYKKKSKVKRILNKLTEVFCYDATLYQKYQYILYKKKFFGKYISMLGINKEKNFHTELDTLVIGSDEVFNCTQDNENVGYSLELFGKNNRCKNLVSYAASFGNTTEKKIDKLNIRNEIEECLNSFDTISVRDDNSYSIVQNLCQITPEKHLDPVLVYDYYRNCNEIPEIKTKEKFMIVYGYSGRITASETKYIQKYAYAQGLKIYSIGGIHPNTDRFLSCSPFKVLSYFRQAECVVTDTFHGSIFSIIAKKPFVTIIRESNGYKYGNEEKLTDLLKNVGLESRQLYDIQSLEDIMNCSIDYKKVDEYLDFQREKTIKYLQKVIV